MARSKAAATAAVVAQSDRRLVAEIEAKVLDLNRAIKRAHQLGLRAEIKIVKPENWSSLKQIMLEMLRPIRRSDDDE